MPRLRLKLQSLLIIVALVALAAGGLCEHARLKRLSEVYERRVILFARRGEPYRRNSGLTHAEGEARSLAIRQANQGAWFKIAVGPSPDRCRRLWPYYKALRQKYERAARYPWLRVLSVILGWPGGPGR